MPSKNTQAVNIYKASHAYVKKVSEAWEALGEKRSIAFLLSEIAFTIPMPTPNGHQPPAADPCKEEEKKP